MGPFAKSLNLREIAEQREAAELLEALIDRADVVSQENGQTTLSIVLPDSMVDWLAEWNAGTSEMEDVDEPDEGDHTHIGEPVSVSRLRRLLTVYLSMKRAGMDMSSEEVAEFMEWEY